MERDEAGKGAGQARPAPACCAAHELAALAAVEARGAQRGGQPRHARQAFPADGLPGTVQRQDQLCHCQQRAVPHLHGRPHALALGAALTSRVHGAHEAARTQIDHAMLPSLTSPGAQH
jgi:hypothetical protein